MCCSNIQELEYCNTHMCECVSSFHPSYLMTNIHLENGLYVEVLHLYLSVIHVLNYAWKWIALSIRKGKLYAHRGVPQCAGGSSIPSVVIGCEPRSSYASVHICLPVHWHFCLLADASQPAEPVSIIYFLLCVKAVASLLKRYGKVLNSTYSPSSKG